MNDNNIRRLLSSGKDPLPSNHNRTTDRSSDKNFFIPLISCSLRSQSGDDSVID